MIYYYIFGNSSFSIFFFFISNQYNKAAQLFCFSVQIEILLKTTKVAHLVYNSWQKNYNLTIVKKRIFLYQTWFAFAKTTEHNFVCDVLRKNA